jgi:hypothetical protein
MSKVEGGFYVFGIRSLCQWDVDNLPYTGLCSHNPLTEGVDFSLSSEDLELAKTRRRNTTAKALSGNQKRVADNIAEKKFYCAVCNLAAAFQTKIDRHLKSKSHLKKIGQYVGKTSAKNLRAKANNKAKKKYYCAICDYPADSQQNLDAHLASKKHGKKLLLSSSGRSS